MLVLCASLLVLILSCARPPYRYAYACACAYVVMKTWLKSMASYESVYLLSTKTTDNYLHVGYLIELFYRRKEKVIDN